eukprot:10013892-Alexandrium_andersonii.AAC.1
MHARARQVGRAGHQRCVAHMRAQHTRAAFGACGCRASALWLRAETLLAMSSVRAEHARALKSARTRSASG